MTRLLKVLMVLVIILMVFVNVYYQSARNAMPNDLADYKQLSWFSGERNFLSHMTSNSSRWFDDLLHVLQDDIMLTKNVKVKEHQWKAIDVSAFRNTHSALLKHRALVYCGWVAYHDAEQLALSGGPAGEFNMWADLITGLVICGVEVTVVSAIVDFWLIVQNQGNAFDMIITDYDGLGTAENIGDFPKHHCKYFIVDYFGTQPMQNTRKINLKHILTPYEYDGSNTAVYMVIKTLPDRMWSSVRDRKGLLWTKDSADAYDWKDLLQQVSKHMPIQTTFAPGARAKMRHGPNITHLGYMQNSTAYLQLLTSSRYLLGVGHPLVGPTALEAIAHGCVFINPLFDPPHVTGKARTTYEYSSQHPFVAENIPEPFSFTIDFVKNQSGLDKVMQYISQRDDKDFNHGYLHPSHLPSGYVQNIYDIFSVMLSRNTLSACQHKSPESTPVSHPGNRVYDDFVHFVAGKCGAMDRCRQRHRLISSRTYALIDQLIPVNRRDEYYKAVFDPEDTDIEDINDMWQMGHRHTPHNGGALRKKRGTRA